MDWHETVFELIDMRSFSNLWYWIALAVVWSTSSHWVLGVPYDLVQRARRRGGEPAEDLRDLVRINVNRIRYIVQVAGLWLFALASCALTLLAILGFAYDVEFCQAVFLLAFPLSLVGLLTAMSAHKIASRGLTDAALFRELRIHRLHVQLVGICAITVTAFWGMWQNMHVGALGG
ncbi:hypothetical protein Ga0609869_002324 [Rhodovulum iodosum]|uniref:Component of SufBCD complex n=1 Tax=Rhodovulum iodosum TaxID=68291 RepID=A0ABV3XUF6_9RHOB|nr:component of SufBCD complex [Rhodovulum robiginosum]RSK35024.1 component of SufBCD complex [Rhodovulum robiginosum]